MGCILGPAKLIRAKDAQAGELLLLTDGSTRATAIVFEFNEDREPLLGILEGELELPYLRRFDSNGLCASYGIEWLIEPEERPSSGPGLIEVGRRAGLLVLTRSGWVMNFATSYVDQFGRFNSEWRDLTTGAATRPENGLLFDSWKLWVIAADRDFSDRRPFITFHAQGQTGRQS